MSEESKKPTSEQRRIIGCIAEQNGSCMVKSTTEESKSPTSEQQRIIDCIVKRNGSCMVKAVAGSGKSTTVKFIAKALLQKCPGKRILFLTYSALLKTDNREKCSRIANTQVDSFHSFAEGLQGL